MYERRSTASEPWAPDICCLRVRVVSCRTAERAAAEEPQCDCLFCGAPGPEASLSCAACKRALPFCAISGRRMLLSDWSACPGELCVVLGRQAGTLLLQGAGMGTQQAAVPRVLPAALQPATFRVAAVS